MRCIVLFYIFLLNFLLIESLPTETSEARRIIGGRNADENEYQYIVRLQYQIILTEHGKIIILEQLHSCTAAVLTPTWTLTASHCFVYENIDLQLEYVEIRPIILYGPQNTTSFSVVMDIFKHPAYKMRMYDLHNDIALIRHETITLDKYARLSGLDFATMIGQEVTLTGYGITTAIGIIKTNMTFVQIASDATTLGKPLQFLDAVVVQCQETVEIMKPGMCLARRCGKSSGLCPGDSGGPVLHSSGVVAVNSIGSQQTQTFCSLQPFSTFYDPAGVTPTSPYVDWISSTIKNKVAKRKKNP